jgi:cytochrome c peroxidase
LFFDSRFSGNKKISCATCHREDYTFTDNLPLSHGMGTTSRRSMPLGGAAYNAWFFWDGRKDSLWAQALGPIESKVEHGISRTLSAFIISNYYRDEYREVFGSFPEITAETLAVNARPADDDPMALKAWVLMDPAKREEVNRIYVHMGKAIAAYVRTIVPGPAPFDRYVETLSANKDTGAKQILMDEEVAGLKLFIGKAQCTNCHNGPLFTNGDFHNIGLPGQDESSADAGRSLGITQVLADEFNCLSRYSDASPRECYELRFIDTADQKYIGAFKTPSLRNVADRAPYMHAGQFATLEEVLDFYRTIADNPELGHRDLTDMELQQLAAFLRTLSGPLNSL